MKANAYRWLVMAILFASLGVYLLVDSVQHSGPYSEGWILLGGTLAALGLTALFFAFQQLTHMQRLAQHMRRHPFYFIGPGRRNDVDVSVGQGTSELKDEK